MSSQTFYLKYRPQKISELDNELVAEKLSAYLKTGNVPHAFLFVGHKGTGKTSSARIIAKAINCECNAFAEQTTDYRQQTTKEKKSLDSRSTIVKNNKGVGKDSENFNSFEPCNECEICKLITEGNDPDVLEIDAASNTSVEDIRDLRDKVRFLPVISRYKVYIIDEVHMISKSAFNALLKTLEEPPQKTIFILATTEREKVPDTIVSRCLEIEFKKADFDSIKRSINRIVRGENLKISDEAISSIVKISSGSFRDAAKILEQAVYLSQNKEITKDVVDKITGGTTQDEVFNLLNCIVDFEQCSLSAERMRKAILLIETLKEKNVDLRVFVKDVLEVLHDVLLFKIGVEKSDFRIEDLAKKMLQKQLKTAIEFFEKAYQEMKWSDVMELPVELAIIEIVNSGLKIEGSNLKNKEKILPDSSAGKDEIDRIDNNNVFIGQNLDTSSHNQDVLWKKLISLVNEKSKQLAGIMRSCKFLQTGKNEFQIETTSKFHLDRLNDEKAKALIQKCACDVIGQDVKIKMILIDK